GLRRDCGGRQLRGLRMDRCGLLSARRGSRRQRVGSLAPDDISNPKDSNMDLIEPGKKAPHFSLKDQNGKTHRLDDYAGKPVVLFFYPRDSTPGCTKEACDFEDALPRFKTIKAMVLGISILDEASKAR